MKIYIIRHGEAAKSWEVDRDPELSLRGREQAQNISDILAQEDLNDFQIISSPLRRAIETAEPISKKLKKEVEINESFRWFRFKFIRVKDIKSIFFFN